jgi:hypothetical protein
MRRAKGAKMWSRRNWSGSGRSGAAKEFAKASSLVRGVAAHGVGGGCCSGNPACPETKGVG